MSIDESKKRKYPFSEHIAVGLIASGGLLSAACISALPSAQCKAMAEAYFEAIIAFGLVAIAGLGVLLFAYWPTPVHRSRNWGIYVIVAIGVIWFAGGITASERSLRAAVALCWVDKSAPPGAPSSSARWILENLPHP